MGFTCSVYAIKNKVTQRVYVGATTVGISERMYHHFLVLKKGKHYNSNLQNDWVTYGPDAFEILALEETPLNTGEWDTKLEWPKRVEIGFANRHLVRTRENFWINHFLKFTSLYNIPTKRGNYH